MVLSQYEVMALLPQLGCTSGETRDSKRIVHLSDSPVSRTVKRGAESATQNPSRKSKWRMKLPGRRQQFAAYAVVDDVTISPQP